MSIKTIEIICRPCEKCEELERRVHLVMKNLETDLKVKLPYEFKRTTSLMGVEKYGVNASQAPILLLNDHVELAGRTDPITLRKKMESVHKSC